MCLFGLSCECGCIAEASFRWSDRRTEATAVERGPQVLSNFHTQRLLANRPLALLRVALAEWHTLPGYLPVNRERAAHVLAKKRSEYNELLQHYYEKETPSVDEAKLLRQLRVDIPRTHSGRLFFSHPRIQACMERALFLWAVKNPASGYVQGMNDLITPFLSVFLESSLVSHFVSFVSRCLLPSPIGVAVPSSLHGALSFPVVLHFGCAGRDPDTVSIDEIPGRILHEVEADSFWCLSKLLAHIQKAH
ncbi:TBC domain containing protein [Toxoplasma gondii ARI]|uniref:TBC domain containing protein n=1 Tax=Toxoplasma gondii ARI TaxID=1074872 RepID=A0A139XYL1_TOXGO|nr:TBC domain containing protein [Toxoplasma gondii ARI]